MQITPSIKSENSRSQPQVGISRRDFLIGLAAFSVPGLAANNLDDPVVIQFHGTSHSAGIRILDGKRPSEFTVDATSVETYTRFLQSPPMPGDSDSIKKLSCMLYELLWKPLDDRGLNAPRIFIHATGVFEGFPFESLSHNSTYLGQRLMIHYLVGYNKRPNVSRLGKVHFDTSFVYAPVVSHGLDLPKLPSSVQEARFVNRTIGGQLRIGNKATSAQLRLDIARPFSILHLATHGVNSRNDMPGIAFRRNVESKKDLIEIMGPKQISSMKMVGRLVVLSACNSATGSASKNSVGLGEAFVHAGAKEVIGANWAIDDDATEVFMKSFYSRLARGVNSASALRYARASMISSEYVPYNQPYFWASFVSLVKG
jgi:CHAT domain-containing protein